MLSFILQALAGVGIREVFMVIGFKGELIRSVVGSGGEHGVTIEYLQQPKWTGTAAALNIAHEAVGDEPFLALYGDLLANQSCLESVLEKSRECSKVIGVAHVGNPSDYGVVELKGDTVTRIREKPSAKITREAWVNTGIYVLDSDIFRSIRQTPRSRRSEYELTASLQRLIDEGKQITAAAISREDWMDIGKPWDLLEANERVLMNFTPQVKGTVEPGATIKGPVWLEGSASIKSGCYVEGPAYIGERSTVGPNSRIRPCTSIGNEVNVGTSCEVKNSIIMSGSRVPHLSYIGDSIIGENCNLGAGTITANIRLDEAEVNMKLKGRLRSSGRRKLGTIMGDGVQTGINSSIMPGVRVGASSYIGPGVVLYEDVPENQMIFARQTLVRKPARRHIIEKSEA
jgi:bifunctional UDP-N-acetylglucosamine pyrophosphorylase/glucosamine-1-phosphate N-acetyltransferase